VNTIRLTDCMGFCCVWLSCYCEQYKVKTNFLEIGWDVDWDALAQDKDQWWSCCECGNERSDSIKCEEFLEWLRNCSHLNRTL